MSGQDVIGGNARIKVFGIEFLRIGNANIRVPGYLVKTGNARIEVDNNLKLVTGNAKLYFDKSKSYVGKAELLLTIQRLKSYNGVANIYLLEDLDNILDVKVVKPRVSVDTIVPSISVTGDNPWVI